MEYRNSRLPEGINTGTRHPLHELSVLLAGVTAITVAIIAGLSLSADYLARKIPLAVEQDWAAPFFADSDDARIDAYLNRVAAELAPAFTLRDGQHFVVHYRDDSEVNAFAHLGGHIIVTRGLLNVLESENALAMVLAHEMAHVVERHPIRSLGRGVIVAAFFATVAGIAPEWLNRDLASEAGVLTVLKFSRVHETAADDMALAAIDRRYGHRAGADELFAALVVGKGGVGFEPPEFLSTHPATARRLRAVRGAEPGPAAPRPVPLPQTLKAWLARDDDDSASGADAAGQTAP